MPNFLPNQIGGPRTLPPEMVAGMGRMVMNKGPFLRMGFEVPFGNQNPRNPIQKRGKGIDRP